MQHDDTDALCGRVLRHKYTLEWEGPGAGDGEGGSYQLSAIKLQGHDRCAVGNGTGTYSAGRFHDTPTQKLDSWPTDSRCNQHCIVQ